MSKRLTVFIVILTLIIASILRLPLGWLSGFLKGIPIDEHSAFVGTVWKGAITDIPGIGNVHIRTMPLGSLRGKPMVKLSTTSPGLSLTGSLLSPRRASVQGSGQVAALSHLDGRLGNLSGGYSLDVTEMKFGEGCESASGQVSTDVLDKNAQFLQWRGPILSGPVSCENGDFLVSLFGQDQRQTVSATIRIASAGTFRSEIEVETTDPRAGAVLPLYGFSKTGRGYRILEQGRWR